MALPPLAACSPCMKPAAASSAAAACTGGPSDIALVRSAARHCSRSARAAACCPRLAADLAPCGAGMARCATVEPTECIMCHSGARVSSLGTALMGDTPTGWSALAHGASSPASSHCALAFDTCSAE